MKSLRFVQFWARCRRAFCQSSSKIWNAESAFTRSRWSRSWLGATSWTSQRSSATSSSGCCFAFRGAGDTCSRSKREPPSPDSSKSQPPPTLRLLSIDPSFRLQSSVQKLLFSAKWILCGCKIYRICAVDTLIFCQRKSSIFRPNCSIKRSTAWKRNDQGGGA